MAHNNLLPWRVKERDKKKKDFIAIMMGVAFVAIVIAYLWVSNANGKVDHQRQRNEMLKTEIATLESKVAELNDLQKRREDLLALMKLIRDLEGTRSVIVHHFDELVRALPDGVYLVSVKRQGQLMSIEGYAESNNRVSSFMRNLDASEWYAEPNLASVDAAPDQGGQANAFSMTVKTIVSKAQKALQEQQKEEQ